MQLGAVEIEHMEPMMAVEMGTKWGSWLVEVMIEGIDHQAQ